MEQVEEVATMSDLLRVAARSRENPMFAEDHLARAVKRACVERHLGRAAVVEGESEAARVLGLGRVLRFVPCGRPRRRDGDDATRRKQ
jgi:hypothetical protein